jgi:hypothetical protein
MLQRKQLCENAGSAQQATKQENEIFFLHINAVICDGKITTNYFYKENNINGKSINNRFAPYIDRFATSNTARRVPENLVIQFFFFTFTAEFNEI